MALMIDISIYKVLDYIGINKLYDNEFLQQL